MTNSRKLFLSFLLVFVACIPDHRKKEVVASLVDSSLSSIVGQIKDKSNPFEFYKTIYENFRFELKSSVIQSARPENSPPLESVTIFESNENDENHFYKKSLEPISEVEWTEKDGKISIRYDDSKNFLRTSYNPAFEEWKVTMFKDIESVFDLKTLEKKTPKTEKNMWSCFESEQQKFCIDSKTGLPVFGKAIKQLRPDTAISTIFSVSYGSDIEQKQSLQKNM